jgi:galactonate dehydratase
MNSPNSIFSEQLAELVPAEQLQITKVRTLVVNAEQRNWILVKIETNQPGLYGWGEASLEMKTRGVLGAIEDLTPLVVGENPTRIEHLYQKLYRGAFFREGVIGMSAISGIEHALWDIFGKVLNVPVYKLLGGAVRERARMYTHLGGGEWYSVYRTFDPGPLVELAHKVIAQGYTALKVVCVPYSEPLMGAEHTKKFAKAIEKLRLAIGDSIDLMIDFHGRTYPATAIQYINAVEEFSPFFCEEPVPCENIDALAEVRRAVRVPIATGERLVTRYQFRRIFELQACHVIQPDLCHCGGLLEARKIAAMAEAYYMGVAPHNPLGPIANCVALHFALATPNFLIQEDMLADVPWRWDVVQTVLKTENGFWLTPDAPGLGIEVNEEEAAKHPFKQESFSHAGARAQDGAVLDF